MKKSFKILLRFATAIMVCAFAMPSMASALSWSPVSTHHTLDSSDFGFISNGLAAASMCSNAQLTADVVSPAVMEITAASFTGCI